MLGNISNQSYYGCRPIRPRACVRSRNPGLFACGAVRTFIVSRKEKNIMAKYI